MLYDCKGDQTIDAANGGGNANAINHAVANGAGVPAANNEDLRNSGVGNGISLRN
jgi:hypothetical protein